MTRALRIAIDVGREESALSIMLRAARANHFGSVKHIDNALGCSRRKLAWNEKAIAALNLLVGRSGETGIRPIHLCGTQGPPRNVLRDRVDYLGIELSKLHFRSSGIAYCPVCLRGQGVHRFVFQLSLCGICPSHGMRLSTVCQCGAPIDERSLFSRFCVCKRDLRRAEPGAVYEGARNFWSEIERRLCCEEVVRLGDSPLGNLTVDDVLSLLAVFLSKELGVYAPSLDYFLRSAAELDQAKLASVSEAAVQRMLEWRKDVFDIVEMVRPLGGKSTLLETFSASHRSLMYWRLPESLRSYQEEVVDLLDARRVREKCGAPLSRGPETDSYVLAEDAAALLGIKPDEAFSIFRQPGEVVTGGRPRWLNARNVDTFRKSLRKNVFPSPLSEATDFVTVAEAKRAAASLGIDLTTLMWALADGAIPAWFSWQGRPTLATTHLDRRGFAEWCRQNCDAGAHEIKLRSAIRITGFDEEVLHRLDNRELANARSSSHLPDGRFVLQPLLDLCVRYTRLNRTSIILNLPKFKVEARFRSESPESFALIGPKGELHIAEELECRRILYAGKPWT